VKQL
jgi:hypothetical protein